MCVVQWARGIELGDFMLTPSHWSALGIDAEHDGHSPTVARRSATLPASSDFSALPWAFGELVQPQAYPLRLGTWSMSLQYVKVLDSIQ
jgi:hypothetical protein